MATDSDSKRGTDDPFVSWMKAATEFWEPMAKAWSGLLDSAASSAPEGDRGRAARKAALKGWQAMFTMMTDPASFESMTEGIGTVPELSTRLLQTSIEGVLEFQKRWAERLKKSGQATGRYDFGELDREFLDRWTDTYKTEFRQFLKMPQLGLTRFYQEKFNAFIDKTHLFQAALAEFHHLLYLPMEKTLGAMQEELAKLTESGELPEDSKYYYQMWIKMLEGHYMTLFKSPEYTRNMAKTLDTLNDVVSARQEVMEDLLKQVPVPTQTEMDELYKEIYLLKKRIRTLEKEKNTGRSE